MQAETQHDFMDNFMTLTPNQPWLLCLEQQHRRSVRDPAKVFLTSKVINFFSNPTHKTETGIACRWERLLKTTHLDQSNYLANQKQGPVNKYGFFDCVY
jgi:hypothetical protein